MNEKDFPRAREIHKTLERFTTIIDESELTAVELFGVLEAAKLNLFRSVEESSRRMKRGEAPELIEEHQQIMGLIDKEGASP